jgi:hypothetical protein
MKSEAATRSSAAAQGSPERVVSMLQFKRGLQFDGSTSGVRDKDIEVTVGNFMR